MIPHALDDSGRPMESFWFIEAMWVAQRFVSAPCESLWELWAASRVALASEILPNPLRRKIITQGTCDAAASKYFTLC
jgi:hypothetical protein